MLSHPYASAIREKLYAGRFKDQKELKDVKPEDLTAEEKQEVTIWGLNFCAVDNLFLQIYCMGSFFSLAVLRISMM